GMPLETYSPTLVPDPTLAPDSGLVRTTSPLSRSEFTSPDTDASNPSSASFLVASSTVMPRTSGTCVDTPSMLPGSGFLKSSFGRSRESWAPSIICFHTGPGRHPPHASLTYSPLKVRPSRLSCGASTSATATAVASCGVYPANQTDTALSVVPVLPAAIRPSSSCILLPVAPEL